MQKNTVNCLKSSRQIRKGPRVQILIEAKDPLILKLPVIKRSYWEIAMSAKLACSFE